MSNAQPTTLDRTMLVLTDQAGNHYLLPLETLERSRVPAEHTAELERLMAAATQGDTDGADAQGYAALIVGAVAAAVFRFGFDVGYGLTKWYLNSQVEQVVPDITITGSREPLSER